MYIYYISILSITILFIFTGFITQKYIKKKKSEDKLKTFENLRTFFIFLSGASLILKILDIIINLNLSKYIPFNLLIVICIFISLFWGNKANYIKKTHIDKTLIIQLLFIIIIFIAFGYYYYISKQISI